MPGIVNVQNSTTERNRLARGILVAIRELIKQPGPDKTTFDLAAFIAIALSRISQIVETTTQAWERRGYWVKADRFRLDWEWTDECRKAIELALEKKDWGSLATILSKIASKFTKVKISPKTRVGTPWVGAWEAFQTKKSR